MPSCLETVPRPDTPLDRLLQGVRLVAVAWLLLVGVWSGPHLGATLVYANGLMLTEAVLAVTLLILAWRRRVCPVETYPFFWPSLGVLALVALATGARAWAFDIPFDGLGIWRYGEPMLRGVLLYLGIAGHPRLPRLAWQGLLLGTLLLAAAAILQHVTGVTRWYPSLDLGWASGFRPIQGDRAQGLTSYINLTAALLAAALPCWALPLSLRVTPSRWGRAALAAGMLAVLAGLWYTNSRGPILAEAVVLCLVFARISPRWGLAVLLTLAAFLLAVIPAVPAWALAAALLAALLGYFAQRRHARLLIPIALGLGLAGTLQVLDAYVLHYPLGWRIANEGVTDRARMMIYREGLRLTAVSPLWGVGDQAINARFSAFPHRGLRRLPDTQRNIHNQYLQWSAAEGIPVALAFTLLVGWVTWWFWRRAPGWPDPFARALGLSAAAGLAVFLLTNLTDAHFWRIEGGGFFWTLAAVAVAVGHSQPLAHPLDSQAKR